MKKSFISFALLFAVLIAQPILQSAIHPAYATSTVSNCVCDHWYNKYYLGTPYDLWTGSGDQGYYNTGSFFSTVDEFWQAGYGADQYQWHPYSSVGPIAQYWSLSAVGSGTYYNYTLGYVYHDDRYAEDTLCRGFYDDIYWLSQNAYNSREINVKADNTFNLNNGNYYTLYGSSCSIIAPYTYLLAAQTTQSTQSSQPTELTPLFDIQVTYAFVGQRADQLSLTNPFQKQTSIATLNAASLYPSLICLNAKYTANATNEVCDAAIEVYQIQVTTDTGVTESYICTAGTNIDPTFSNVAELTLLRPYIEKLAQVPCTNAMSGYFNLNLTIGNSLMAARIGSAGKYQSDPSSLGFWSAGQPNNATLSVHRLGCILLKGDSASVYYSNSQAITTIQLAKYGNGLLYNTAVPPAQMQQLDPFDPPV